MNVCLPDLIWNISKVTSPSFHLHFYLNQFWVCLAQALVFISSITSLVTRALFFGWFDRRLSLRSAQQFWLRTNTTTTTRAYFRLIPEMIRALCNAEAFQLSFRHDAKEKNSYKPNFCNLARYILLLASMASTKHKPQKSVSDSFSPQNPIHKQGFTTSSPTSSFIFFQLLRPTE